MNWLDWLVIGIYGFGMIGVGFYYMRRTKSTDDYLLGGRTMKPWTVGLSLFATLLSTISYLATPGEIIQYGPMLLGQVVAMPVVYWIIGWFFMASLIWYVCTSGSDQMSIQRFLATSDVKAARRVIGVSLIANAAVLVFLSMLGFALLAYFQVNPNMLKDGQTIIADADQLLPQYIVLALPAGISGLIVAGLLAAAMSSLSSGVNSSSSVITVDFIDRFRKIKLSEVAHIRIARYVTVAVGVVVVSISFYVSAVPGNLLEVTFRIVNLLVSPLFILFCMAMFITWATEFGTWVATLCSIGVAVIIAFWESIFGVPGPSFLFIMPASLVVGVVVGMTASLIPVGRGARPMLSKADDK